MLQVALSGGVEEWLVRLISEIRETVRTCIDQAVRDVQILHLDDCCYEVETELLVLLCGQLHYSLLRTLLRLVLWL